MKKDGMYYNKLGKILSNDLQVMAMVYDYNIADKPIWFSKLVSLFEGNISKINISKAQDRLGQTCLDRRGQLNPHRSDKSVEPDKRGDERKVINRNVQARV